MYPNVSKEVSPRAIQENNLFALGSQLLSVLFRVVFFYFNKPSYLNPNLTTQLCVMCARVSGAIKQNKNVNIREGWRDQANTRTIYHKLRLVFSSIAVKAAQDSFTDWLWWNLFGYWFCLPFPVFLPISQLSAGQTIETSPLKCYGLTRKKKETKLFLRLKSQFYSWFELIERHGNASEISLRACDSCRMD